MAHPKVPVRVPLRHLHRQTFEGTYLAVKVCRQKEKQQVLLGGMSEQNGHLAAL